MDNRNNDAVNENRPQPTGSENQKNSAPADRGTPQITPQQRMNNNPPKQRPMQDNRSALQQRRPPRMRTNGDGNGISVERVNVSAPGDVFRETVNPNSRPAPRDAQTNEETRVLPTKSDATKMIDTAQKNEIPEEVKANKEKNQKEKKSKVKKEKKPQSEAGNTVMSIVKCMAYITAVFAVSIIISVAVIFIANDMYGFVKSDEPVEITVPENATVEDVAKILHDNNIIKYEWLFKMKEGDFAGKFAAGTYTVSPRSSYDELIYLLREKAPSGISWITIPEGFTTDEIINLLVESGIGKKEAYIDVINNYEFDYWFVEELGDDWADDGRIYRLDGYLFPDTYQFYNASSEETVIKKLLARFNQVFIDGYRERAEELGYSVDDILNIASLIEKEAGTAADFGNVSSVFHNRLNNPASYPYLESDATIAYAIQHETGIRPTLTGEDIDNNNSPYNSYKEPGLMPGPIANPSNSAILAALNPSATNYYFFVASDTETIFSATKEEHDAAIQQILQDREENAAANAE